MATHLIEEARAGEVTLDGVSRIYGTNYAVRDLHLQVKAGEFLSLLGPSGCGKTTTLRMIGGFEYPDTGTISIAAEQVQELPPHRRPVNTVFQAYALFPHLSVAQNIAYGLHYQLNSKLRTPKSERRERVAEALKMVRMEGYAERMPAQLSGGQQQRIALARALVNRPAVLLLDEPMSALDRKLREEMQIELKLLQQQLGTTFVFVTHDQEEAMTMSDRIAVMKLGRIEQIGAPAEVYDAPASAYVAGFIGQQNFFSGTLAGGPGGWSVDIPGATITSSRLPAGSGAAVGAAAEVAIRPEHVAIEAADSGSTGSPSGEAHPRTNALTTTLMSVSQLGSYLQIVTITADGLKVVVRAPRSIDIPTKPGVTVCCSWPADAVHVFPASPSKESE